MLLDFQFDPVRHRYTTEGRFCLATSDVVALCGIGNLDMVPSSTLKAAAERGTCLHKAIEDYEHGRDWQKKFNSEYQAYLDGYFRFRDDYEIQVLPPMEKSYVYLHDCDVAIGCTIDQRFLMDDTLFINDIKSVYRQTGKMLKQFQLKWRLQTESYREASERDEAFMKSIKFSQVKRSVIHCHPKYKKGYEFYVFEQDDADLWRGAVMMALEKTAAGLVPPQRELSFQEALEMSVKGEEDELREDIGDADQRGLQVGEGMGGVYPEHSEAGDDF